MSSEIDSWIDRARRHVPPHMDSWSTLISVHHETTRLFERISGEQKRSLASKYLHFHVPQLFFIYDTRAKTALSRLGVTAGRSRKSRDPADEEYRRFSKCCLLLQQDVLNKHGFHLNPRQLDNLLLFVAGTMPARTKRAQRRKPNAR